jgi:hypothetical protein
VQLPLPRQLHAPGVLVALAALALHGAAPPAHAAVPLTRVSADPYTNTTSQHRTEVEPDTFSFGSTIVGAFQVGRFYDGGASNIGWATSTNGGGTWASGALPGTTTFATPAGSYARVSDPSVAYDPKHNVWLIASLPLNANVSGAGVLVNRSTDGGATWGNPVTVATAGSGDLDKDWIVCDGTTTSPFYGNCYVEYDDFGNGNQVHVAYSTDGGLTWAQGSLPSQSVIGGQPVVQPNGTVLMPIDTGSENSVISLRSTNGGVSWTGPFTIASIASHGVRGNLRTDSLPSAEIDGSGKVYVVWQDCRFRRGCSANDIVMSTSTDGQTWSSPSRIPIDSTKSNVDHFIPGLAVDPSTSGSSAHLGLAYYYYPNTKCNASNCQLDVGYVSSSNGGTTWSAPAQLAGPMSLSWLPNTSLGRMVGDYISTSFSGGTARPVFAVASAPTSGGSDCSTATPNCAQPVFTTASGLAALSQGFASNGDKALPDAASDHAAPQSAFFR